MIGPWLHNNLDALHAEIERLRAEVAALEAQTLTARTCGEPREGVWNPNGEGEQADVPGGRAKDNAREKKPVIAYACLYTRLVEVARAHGYALAMHGSLIADCDLIAVPWVESACSDEELAEALRAASAGVLMTDNTKARVAGVRKHVIHLGGGPYLDITVVPLHHEPRT